MFREVRLANEDSGCGDRRRFETVDGFLSIYLLQGAPGKYDSEGQHSFDQY